MAIIGGQPERFAPYVDLFHRALDQLGTGPAPIAVHSGGHVADSDEQAKDELWPHHRDLMGRIGRERGWAPQTRAQFEAEAVSGSIYVGSAETVAKKIANTSKLLGVSRFNMKYSAGTLSHEHMMHCIELYGREVMPRVRALMSAAA